MHSGAKKIVIAYEICVCAVVFGEQATGHAYNFLIYDMAF